VHLLIALVTTTKIQEKQQLHAEEFFHRKETRRNRVIEIWVQSTQQNSQTQKAQEH
jgi:hypothetical protein